MINNLIEALGNFSISIYNVTSDIINDAHKSFITAFVGTGASTLPTYICDIIGTKTPNIIMTLQTIGLIITILLGVVSLVKNIWDLFDKICTKFKHKKQIRKK
jgi:hypothetical protein